VNNLVLENIFSYADRMALNKDKLKNHSTSVTRDDILKIYRDSLKL